MKTVEETKHFRNIMATVEKHAKLIQDTELERNAAIARIRSERSLGLILIHMEKAKGTILAGRDTLGGTKKLPPKNDAKTLLEIGLTKQQSAVYQMLSRVPLDEFESRMELEGYRPKVVEIIASQKRKEQAKAAKAKEGKAKAGKGKQEPDSDDADTTGENIIKRMPPISLCLWDELMDMEKDSVFDIPLKNVLDPMTPSMRDDVERLLPKLKRWLQ